MKIVVTVEKDVVAPRFDFTREVLFFDVNEGNVLAEARAVVLPRASAEELCAFILKEAVDMVICGGIESQYFEYLTWKNVTVIDRVIGQSRSAVQAAVRDSLSPGAVLR